MKTLYIVFNFFRLIPHLFLFFLHPKKNIIKYEVTRWLEITNRSKNVIWGFLELMIFLPEFRNLFYYRIGKLSYLIRWMCPPMNTLYIKTKNIGPGLFIQHGFSTIITAKSIGDNCWINQQVTIGYSNLVDCPVIGNNVSINAGAKIIGNVIMGNGSVAGANSVVVKNVPENCTVVGVPAYIIRRNGKRVRKDL